MRGRRRGAAFCALLALACLVPATSLAQAEELLVMPYTCEIGGERPRLTPGPERGYRIVGEREQRRFNACSPANPGMCQRWTVYRFDLDCDGERVSWVEVVAAANRSSRRARLVDGRLELRMPPRWSLSRDDPCAYERGDDPFGDWPSRRRCAERLARAPPAVVELPRGFAPMLGIDAIFVRAAPRFAKAPPPGNVEAGAEQAQPNDDPPPSKPAGEGTARRTPPAASPPPPPPPLQPGGEGSAKRTPPAAPPPPRSVQEANSKAKPPAPPEPPPGKKIASLEEVAALSPPPTAAAPKRAQPPPSSGPPPKSAAGPDVKPAPKVAAPPLAPKREAPAQPPAGTPAQKDEHQPALFSFRALRSPATGVVVVFTGVTVGLLIAFAVARRRERLQGAGAPRRRTRGIPQLRFDDGSEPRGGEEAPLGRIPGASAADAALAAWGEKVPQTRAEAIQALGIGARRTTADPAAIKRIVATLRRHWHPDRARDEADRRLRELRSKQINAAWDLLQGERADA